MGSRLSVVVFGAPTAGAKKTNIFEKKKNKIQCLRAREIELTADCRRRANNNMFDTVRGAHVHLYTSGFYTIVHALMELTNIDVRAGEKL